MMTSVVLLGFFGIYPAHDGAAWSQLVHVCPTKFNIPKSHAFENLILRQLTQQNEFQILQNAANRRFRLEISLEPAVK